MLGTRRRAEQELLLRVHIRFAQADSVRPVSTRKQRPGMLPCVFRQPGPPAGTASCLRLFLYKEERNIMTFRSSFTGLAAALTLVGLVGGVANAQNLPIAGVVGTNPNNTDVTFDGTTLSTISGGVLVTASGPANMVGNPFNNARFNFGPITFVSGSASSTTFNGVTTIGANFTTAGQPAPNFSIFAADNSVLLTGVFGGAALTSTSNSSGTIQSIGFNTVTYTGGSFLTQFLANNGGSSAVGTFGVTLSGVNPAFGITGGTTASFPGLTMTSGANLNGFTAAASGATFDATSVPEPGEYAAMGMAGMSVMGLMVRARRKAGRSTTVAAA